jgi:5'-methylthioadenosine phosphorylase
MKALGVSHVLSASAVGSLREELAPLHIVVPDQLFDRTTARPSTFFGEGVAAHVGFADPFCPMLSQAVVEHGRAAGVTVHDGGTYVCIEGPHFSTRAESNVYRQLGFDIIGMTNLQEAKLAREAEICYATMALVTDYDVWYAGVVDVTLEQVINNMRRNVEAAQAIVRLRLPARPRECHHHVRRTHSGGDQTEARPAYRQVHQRSVNGGEFRFKQCSSAGRDLRPRGGSLRCVAHPLAAGTAGG